MLTLSQAVGLAPVEIIFIGTEARFWTLYEEEAKTIGPNARDVHVSFVSTGDDALGMLWKSRPPAGQQTVIYGLLSWMEGRKITRTDILVRYFGAFSLAGFEIKFGDSHSSSVVDKLLHTSSS